MLVRGEAPTASSRSAGRASSPRRSGIARAAPATRTSTRTSSSRTSPAARRPLGDARRPAPLPAREDRRLPLRGAPPRRAHAPPRRRVGTGPQRHRRHRRHPRAGARRASRPGGAEIEAEMARRGVTSARAAEIAALDTRQAKDYEVDPLAMIEPLVGAGGRARPRPRHARLGRLHRDRACTARPSRGRAGSSDVLIGPDGLDRTREHLRSTRCAARLVRPTHRRCRRHR